MKCVLFDLDGTIADTEILKAKALSQAVNEFGGNVSLDIYRQWMGQSWEVVTSAFFKEAKINIQLEHFNPVFRDYYGRLLETDLVEKKGLEQLLELLNSKCIPVGLVSSASPWMIKKTICKLGFEKTFDVIVSNADTKRHKPHPDAYLIALNKLQVDASRTIAFEDSESGFQSAKAAGLKVFGVRHIFNSNHNFDACAGIVESFEECLSWTMFRT